MQTLFIISQSILIVLFLIQDTVNLAPFNNQVAELKHLGWKKIIIGTAITSGCAAFSLYVTIHYAGQHMPYIHKLFLVLWWGTLMLGMVHSWYRPYFFGPTEKDLEQYRQFFTGTHSILPMRKGYPGPNTLHLVLHFFMIACAALAALKVLGKF